MEAAEVGIEISSSCSIVEHVQQILDGCVSPFSNNLQQIVNNLTHNVKMSVELWGVMLQ